jgi:IclR family transcriptional regulator, KDG regulon repressor
MDDDSFDPKQPESVAAVLKVFAILQALAERNESGISELSMRLAMPKATVYRFLQTMKSLGYVRQETDSERYGLTMKMFELGTMALQYPDLVELAKPHMQELADVTGETVHLGMLIDSEIIYGRLAPHAGDVFARWPARAAALHRNRQGAPRLGRPRAPRADPEGL